jgi:Snf7
MLPYLRSWLGTEQQQPAKKQAPRAAVDADVLLRAQRMQLAQLRDEEKEVRADMESAVRERNQAQVRVKLARLKQLEGSISVAQGKLDNLNSQQRLLQSADSNVQQGVLMGAGADQLEALVQEADDIDLDDIVDRLQDGAVRTHEFSTRLSEPLMPADDGGGDIDEQVQEMMQRAEDERLAGLLDAPTTAAVPATRPLRQQPEGMY